MQVTMKNEGPCRKGFILSGPPPCTFKASKGRSRDIVPVFQPYQEALPLESGYYSFVLDSRGRFHVERGNTRSHSGMVRGERVGAAGHFWISRAGKVGKVVCTSSDYRFYINNPQHRTVHFVIQAFNRHQAFDVSQHAIFQFSRGLADSFSVSTDGHLISDIGERERLLESEDQGSKPQRVFSSTEIAAFTNYVPSPPPKLYPMHHDQQFDQMDFDDNAFEYGDFRPPYSPTDNPLSSGRKAFVIDHNGRLIIGSGHQLLSGGNHVGAAGQFHVDDAGFISEVGLNFSGHYRPPLSAEYARYTYRSLFKHPLLTFSDRCHISARIFFDVNTGLNQVSFVHDELISDEFDLDSALKGQEFFM